MIIAETGEDRRQLAFLNSPLGEPGSGRIRYAAAMYFFQQGKLDAAELERYRVVSKLDDRAHDHR